MRKLAKSSLLTREVFLNSPAQRTQILAPTDFSGVRIALISGTNFSETDSHRGYVPNEGAKHRK